MKKTIISLALAAILVTILLAEERMYIFRTDKSVVSYSVSAIDSVKFADNQTAIQLFFIDKSKTTYSINEIDSLVFAGTPDTVKVTYNGNTVVVQNPLNGAGVDITVNGADVIVFSSLTDNQVIYQLKGNSNDGMFKIYSAFKFELILGGLTLTNNDGPAINIQSKKRIDFKLADGTINTLIDGTSYASSTEDQKGTIFSEGQLIFKGTGTLSVKGNKGHAICSDDYIEIESGNIIVTGAAKDGIHSKDHFNLEGGTLNINATGDAVECETGKIKIEGGSLTSTIASADAKGLKCDSTFTMTGGNLNLTVTGNQGKGIKSVGKMSISGGNITVNTSGGVVLNVSGSGYEPSYCTAIKCDSTINISGATITIIATGAAGKGISADADIKILSGTVKISTSGTGATYKNATNVTDSYNATCLTTDGNLIIKDGSTTCSSSGSGGKAISAFGTITIGDTNFIPTINLTTTGAKFLMSGSDYCHPKALKADGAITINNCAMTINSTDDGVHSETSITINNGDITILNSLEGIESKYIYLNGGTTNVTASNDGLNATMGLQVGGTESNDNSLLSISGGTHFVNATNGDAIDSNGNILMTGGTVFANGPNSGVEEAVDFNGSFNMNGGTFIGVGSNSNMTKAMSTTSTQANMYLSSSSMVASTTLMTVTIGGVATACFKPKVGGYKFLISTPQMTKGAAYVIYTGGTYTGGTSVNNLYQNGTFSTTGATAKKSGTLSTSSTVNSITF